MCLVSVIIPTYNSEKYISCAVDSVLAQNYKELEIIVIDDGSTDKTQTIIKKYSNNVRYIYQKNSGLSNARNKGIKSSKGEFIAILDSDDEWLPKKIELQMEVMRKSASIGIVSCGGYLIDSNGRIEGLVERKNYSSNRLLINDLLLKNVVSGGSFALIRKKCFDKVGMFDENLSSAEDWDMWLRIAKYFDIRFVEKPLARIRVRQESMSAPRNVDTMLINELKVIDKFYSDNGHMGFAPFAKNKAYSLRYYYASWAYSEIGMINMARNYIVKSILMFPFKISSYKNSRIKLLIKAFSTSKIFSLLSRINALKKVLNR